MRVPAPAVSADTVLAVPSATVFHRATQTALAERYEILLSDAEGGVLRLRRIHQIPRRFSMHSHLDYLTVVVTPAEEGTRVLLQTISTTIPQDSTLAVPIREDGRVRAEAFLACLADAC